MGGHVAPDSEENIFANNYTEGRRARAGPRPQRKLGT
jgi:hypothetical protein